MEGLPSRRDELPDLAARRARGRAGDDAAVLRAAGPAPAARSASGYRLYTELDREKLQFISAAKHLGLPLDRIRELLVVWDGGTYRDVRDELRPLIAAQVVTDGGREVKSPADRAGRLVALVVAEQRCCPFFSFRLTFEGAHVELVARAPDNAETLLAALFDLAACPR